MQICSNKERNAAAATAKKKLIALGHGWQTQQQQQQHRQHQQHQQHQQHNQQQQGAPFNRGQAFNLRKSARCLCKLFVVAAVLLLLLLLLLFFSILFFFGLRKLQQPGY